MKYEEEKLSKILRYTLIPLMAIISGCALRLLFIGKDGFAFICIGAAAVGVGARIIFSSLDNKIKFGLIMLIAFILRAVWIICVPSVPVSDYNTMYHCAGAVIEGDFSGMRGVGYFSRYPHLVLSVMYMALMKMLFGASDLLAMKCVSLIFSLIVVAQIYKLSKYFVKTETFSFTAMLFAAVFPPFVTYVSTFCTENTAMPFLLGAVLCFCKIQKGADDKKTVVLCGVLLGIANLFRGVAAIVITAMVIALLLKKRKYAIRIMCAVVAVMMGLTAVVSTALLTAGVTEAHIWQGKESGITYFLKGLNVDSKGAWNKEDADFVEEHLLDENFNEQCINIIKARLSQKSAGELAIFFLYKFTNQWSYADCNGSYWAYMDTHIPYRYPINPGLQLLGAAMLILSLVSLFKNKNGEFLHILLCGFGIFFLIFETQPRYAYIASWVFVLMAAQGAEVIAELLANYDWRLLCKKLKR